VNTWSDVADILRQEHSDGHLLHQVFEAAGDAMPLLEELSVTGNYRTRLVRLPDEMWCLWHLRRLHIVNITIVHASEVLTKLTALTSLVILWDSKLQRDCHDEPQTPLPPGMSALRGLRELRVSCHRQRMLPLALPSLALLQLDCAPPAKTEARPASLSSLTVIMLRHGNWPRFAAAGAYARPQAYSPAGPLPLV